MKKASTILVVGDSTAIQRHDLSYNLTYSYMLQNRLDSVYVINHSRGFLTMKDLYSEFEPLAGFGLNPDVVIIQIGLVDSFPRPIPYNKYMEYIYKGLSYIKLDIEKLLIRTKLYYILGNYFNFKKVSKKDFTYYADSIIEKLNNRKIIIMGIPYPGSKIQKRIKILKSEIDEYNLLLRECCNKFSCEYIDNTDIEDHHFLLDHQHLNELGMENYFNKLKTKIETYLKC